MCLAVENDVVFETDNTRGARGYQTNDGHYSLCLKMARYVN